MAVFSKYARSKPHYSPAPKFELPESLEEKVQCYKCGGAGTAHTCPDCQCKCPKCQGTGELTELGELVKIDRASFNPKYIAWLQSLPNLELDRVLRARKPLRFRFDGGEGLLMPCRA